VASRIAPTKASAHAGNPVKGSSPDRAGSAATVACTPFACFVSSRSSSGFVGGVDAPATSPVGVDGVDVVVDGVDVVGGVVDVVGVVVEVVVDVDGVVEVVGVVVVCTQ
jgi:hypothetical protein